MVGSAARLVYQLGCSEGHAEVELWEEVAVVAEASEVAARVVAEMVVGKMVVVVAAMVVQEVAVLGVAEQEAH